jgi:hypothetical protein
LPVAGSHVHQFNMNFSMPGNTRLLADSYEQHIFLGALADSEEPDVSKAWAAQLPEGWQSGLRASQLSLTDLNRLNRKFGKTREKRDRELLDDPEVATTAFEALKSEVRRQVPIYSQMTLSSALEDAARVRERFEARLSPLVEIGRQIREKQVQRARQPRVKLDSGQTMSELIAELVRRPTNSKLTAKSRLARIF